MEKAIGPATPLYERKKDILWYRQNNRLYEVGSYKMSSEIVFTPYIGNVVLYFHQREFNMITLNGFSLISLFSEAYNYKLTRFFHVCRPSSITDIMQEFNLTCEGCKYVLVSLGRDDYYVFIF